MSLKHEILVSLDMSDSVTKKYLSDLSQADLLIRPVPGMNHIAWQIGHLVATERHFLEAMKPGASPALPEGFDEGHGRHQTMVDDPSKYYSTEEYLRLIDAQREASKAALNAMSDEELEAPGPESFRQMAPTVGSVFFLMGNHFLMHAGQYVAVRRSLDKPIAM